MYSASRLVLDRHFEFLRDFHSNPSFQNREKYAEMRETVRGKIARMLRVSGDEIAIYNLAGEVQMQPGPGPDVTAEVTRGGADAGKLKVLVSIFGRETPVELEFGDVAKL